MANELNLAELLKEKKLTSAQVADILDSGRWFFIDYFGRPSGPAISNKPSTDFPLYEEAMGDLWFFECVHAPHEDHDPLRETYLTDNPAARNLRSIYPVDDRPITRNSASQVARTRNNDLRVIATLLSFIAGTHNNSTGAHPDFAGRKALIEQLTSGSAAEDYKLSAGVVSDRIEDALGVLETHLIKEGAMPPDKIIEQVVFGKK